MKITTAPLRWTPWLLAAWLAVAAHAQDKCAITVAQVGPLDGPVGFYTRSLHDGIAACFSWFNDRGGARGRPLELLHTSLDARQTVEQYTRIVRQHRPVAFMYPRSPTVIDALLDANLGA